MFRSDDYDFRSSVCFISCYYVSIVSILEAMSMLGAVNTLETVNMLEAVSMLRSWCVDFSKYRRKL
jgi:hypothetical protein